MNASLHNARASTHGLLLVAGAVVLAATAGGVFPLAWLARQAASDGTLSDAFLQQLVRGQWALGIACCMAALVMKLAGTRLLGLCPGQRAGWGLALLAGFAALMIQQGVFGGIPHVTDATSHWFQSRILAAGHLAAPLPPCYEAFFQHNIVMSARGLWHTKYFPGQALWLAAGRATGLLTLAMPLAWALCTFCFHRIASRLLPLRSAAAATLLLAMSPLGLLLAGSYMSHTTALMAGLACVAAAWSALASPQRGTSRWLSVLAGCAFGGLVLTRPQDMPPVALALALIACAHGRAALARLPWFVGGGLPAAVCLMVWNTTLYGAPLASGYHFGASPSLTPIIQDAFGFSATYTPVEALRHTLWTLARFDSALLGWPAGLFLVLIGAVGQRPTRREGAAAALAATVILLHVFFPYYGFEFEARYYLMALPACVLLAVRGLNVLGAWMVSRGWLSNEEGPRFAAGLGIAGITYAALFFWPQKILPAYSGDYEQASPVVMNAAEGLSGAIVLVPSEGNDAFRYSSGIIGNDPFLRGPVLYARDEARLLPCLQTSFPERTLYRFVPSADWSTGRLDRITSGL